jgi:hypothetical protein
MLAGCWVIIILAARDAILDRAPNPSELWRQHLAKVDRVVAALESIRD